MLRCALFFSSALLAFCAIPGVVAAATASTVLQQLDARFPELGLADAITAPTLHTATDPVTLQAALSAAATTAGDDLVLLDGSLSQTWECSSALTLKGTAQTGAIVIASLDASGSFARPVTLKGAGIAVDAANSAPIYLAHFGIAQAATVSLSMRSGGLYLLGSGTITATALSITGCGTSAAGQPCYGGAICVMGATATFYNSTFVNNKTALYGAVTNLGGTVNLIHCTLAGNTNATSGVTTGGSSTCSTTNCWLTTETFPLTVSSTTLPHIVPDATSEARDAATLTTDVRYDALGNNRLCGRAADLGAVESSADAPLLPPDDLVALPSGPREVYLGWSRIAAAKDYRLERSADGGLTWTDITEATLWRTPYDAASNPEGTVNGWVSARHLAATPGATAHYRLSFSAEGQSERVTSLPLEVTSPALNTVPLYHSRPGAKQIIYLDFTGYIDDYAANVSAARVTLNQPDLTYLQTAPFVYNARFGDLTRPYPTADAIYDIWRMVAEDFAAFDVDVTTEAPTHDALVKTSEADLHYGKRVVVGYAAGTSTPWYAGSGAFSGGGTFGFPHDRPVYVFSVQSRQNIAAQTTHEVSHTLGLAHDGGTIYFGDFIPNQSYYRGVELTPDGALNTTPYWQTGITWYPVMGAAPLVSSATASDGERYYYDEGDFINQWSNGAYTSADNQEDDFALLLGLKEGNGQAFTQTAPFSPATRNLSLAPDDAGDVPETATALGLLTAATPLTATGVIGKHLETESGTVANDVDCFTLSVERTGHISVSVVPNYQGLSEGASLDARVELLTADGTRLCHSAEPLWDTSTHDFSDIRNACCTFPLEPGTYLLRISGTAHPVSSTTLSPDGSASDETPWHFNDPDPAGSIGPYTLTATFTDTLPKPSKGDTTAYTPEAEAHILAATGGCYPKTLLVDDGKGGDYTAEAVSQLLACLEGALTVSEDRQTVTVGFRFKLCAIAFAPDGRLAVDVAICGAAEGQTVTFAEGITFAQIDATNQRLTPIPEADCLPLEASRQRYRLFFPAEAQTHLFTIRAQR